MLASPLRQCIVTEKKIPADFMIRLAALEVSRSRLSRTIISLLPDGVEHSRFRRRKSSKGYYLTCRKVSIDEMVSRSSYKRIPSQSKIQLHSLLTIQVGYQLRLRVLQELELLAEKLRCAPQSSVDSTVLRRLTRAEWANIKATGRISQPGAVAVLVVPPLNNKSGVPEGSGDDRSREASYRDLPMLPPLSVLHGTQAAEIIDTVALPQPQVPLYNGLALFPSPSLRYKLRKALQTMLLVERRARWRHGASCHAPADLVNGPSKREFRDKASHAYMLRSDRNTVGRADSVPLAIALWRIRMWEGQS